MIGTNEYTYQEYIKNSVLFSFQKLLPSRFGLLFLLLRVIELLPLIG
jgi:hypothetical protein